jgi:ATP-binding cassette subfamily B protein
MIRSFRRIFGIVKEHRGRLILSQVALFISALASIGFATLVAPLVNEGMENGDGEAALRIAFWMLVLAVIMGISMAIAASQAVWFSQGVGYVVRRDLYNKIQSYSFENFDRYSSGQLMVRLNADVINIQNAMLYGILLALYAPFMLSMAFILSAIRTPSLLWLLVAVIVVVLGVMAILVPAVDKAYKSRQQRLDDLNNAMTENLQGMAVVKAFVREDYEIEKVEARSEAMRKPSYEAAWRVAFLSPLLTGIAQIAVVSNTWVGGTQVLEGTLTVGEVTSFSTYLSLVIAPLALMAIVIPYVLRGDVSASRILEVYDEEPAIEDRDDAAPMSFSEVDGRVAFEDVSFGFRQLDGEPDALVLKNINLTIEPGQQVGFLGATGSGKTALVNLIPRFYDVTGGRVTIDDVDVRDIPQPELRQIAGIALQEAVLFLGDLRFNLKFGDAAAEDEVMFDAARAADAWGFVTNLPEQWEAPVARRGYNFSGGQRQRLSITRALTARPKVLILDDSTSALDASTEGRVQEAIPGLMHGGTTIYVAQRISAVIDLDHIYLLENGEIVADGSHEELLESSPLYQEIYESQLGSGVTAGLDLEEPV